MKMNPFLWIGIVGFTLTAAIISVSENVKPRPTVEVYASVEIISCKAINHKFFVPEDFYTLEIRPRRGEFWLVATTPRGDVRLMPGVIYVHKFTRQKKIGNG